MNKIKRLKDFAEYLRDAEKRAASQSREDKDCDLLHGYAKGKEVAYRICVERIEKILADDPT